MIYFNFRNYEEFKEIFGIVEHGNGVKSRRNKILLSLYKDRSFLKAHIRSMEYTGIRHRLASLDRRLDRANGRDERHVTRMARTVRRLRNAESDMLYYYPDIPTDLLAFTDINALKTSLYDALTNIRLRKEGCYFSLNLMGMTMYSNQFETDDMEGLCEDGTLNAIRYRNIEKDHVFRMKAGKMFNHILSCNRLTDTLPEQIQRWLSEEFVAEWIEYARRNIGSTEYDLHVDDNFEDIYTASKCAGYDEDNNSFRSCMVGDSQWPFYQDAVDAKAAYLTDADGMIVARCIVFTDVTDQDGRTWRLAERQYSKFGKPELQRQLVSALIRGGFIDGYKSVGSSCGDARKFVDNEGNSLSDRRFRIRCALHDGDTLSYQDSFKWYDPDGEVADNYGNGCRDLATTESTFYESDEDSHEYDDWSEYNQEYIPNDESCYVDTRDDYFWSHQICSAYVYDSYNGRFTEETCFNDDVMEIGGDYYYAGEDCEDPESWGIQRCPECGEYMVVGRTDTCYSELTDEDYCCGDCCIEAEERWYDDNGWTQAEYDDVWYENPDDVITAMQWAWPGRYSETTISVETFNRLVEDGEATEYGGTYYIDLVLYDGEPVHLSHAVRVAA